MRRTAVLSIVGVIAALALAATTHAITFGENDVGRHPFVGALVGDFQGNTVQICSGTLVSPTVFVTAGHCLVGLEDFGITNVRVTFADVIDADANGRVDPGVTTHPGTGQVHPDWGFPGFGGNAADPHDVAVFVLNAGVTMAAYGQLPSAGLLDTVDKKGTRFTTVGYGAVRDDKTKGPKSLEDSTRRKMATQDALSLTNAWLLLSMNPSTGDGGTCFGDSGGPHFLGAGSTETRIVVSVTVTGDRWCRATDKTYRLDTPSAREFLDDFVTLP